MSLLKVEQLYKRFGKNEAVKGISFSIEQGRCVALLGPNGAGKTTTLKMLAGLQTPTAGSIQFMGMDKVDLRQHIGYLPQYPSFYPWMTGKEYLHYVGQLTGIAPKELKTRVDEMLEWVGLHEAKNRRISGYSGGMKQRLGIAQAMIHQPKILILDEPVSALDPIGRREVLDMIKNIGTHTTVLYSTHVIHDAENVSDDVLIMNKGEIVLSGSIKEIMNRRMKPILHIVGEQPLTQYKQVFAQLDHVLQVDSENDVMNIYVQDLQLGKQQVLKCIVEHQIPIQKFIVQSLTLEDLFLQVVGE